MDAAARELKIDRRAAPPQHDPPRADALHQPDGADLRRGRFEQILDQGLALADWHGFAARRRESEARGRLRGRGIATFLEWTGGNALRGARHRQRHARRLHRDSARPPGHGPGHRHQLRAAGGGRVRRADRAHARRAGRHRPRQRLRQRRLALAVHRRLGARGAPSARSTGAAAGGRRAGGPARPTSNTAAGRFTVAGTDLGIDLFELAGRRPRAAHLRRPHATVGGPTWPNGCHVCEVELDPATGAVEVVAYASVNDIGRVISPPSCAARSTAARCRASARRCASAWPTTTPAASCCPPASWTTPAARRRLPDFKTEFDNPSPAPTTRWA
jgi:carbon-monoxide dehydrogenase large subunit